MKAGGLGLPSKPPARLDVRGLAAGLAAPLALALVLGVPRSAAAVCPCTRADLLVASAAPSIGIDRSRDGYLHLDLEHEWPLWSRITGAVRGTPIYYARQAGGRGVFGLAFGIVNRIYVDGVRHEGFFASIGISTLWSAQPFTGNGSRLNFLSQVAVGYQVPGRPWHLALTLEHTSNAGTAVPNHGVNGLGLAAGLSL